MRIYHRIGHYLSIVETEPRPVTRDSVTSSSTIYTYHTYEYIYTHLYGESERTYLAFFPSPSYKSLRFTFSMDVQQSCPDSAYAHTLKKERRGEKKRSRTGKTHWRTTISTTTTISISLVIVDEAEIYLRGSRRRIGGHKSIKSEKHTVLTGHCTITEVFGAAPV